MLLAVVATGVANVKSLPYAAEADEAQFVEPAWHIARTGDLNPHWLGHPGATVIYPLAGIARAFFPASEDGPPPEFYLVARRLSNVYEVLSVPLVFLIGRQAFGTIAALVGTSLMSILPIAVAHAQVVRTDSAGVFFGLLSIWLCLRIRNRPGPMPVILAALIIGVAVATRYFMATLTPLLLAETMLFRGRQSASVRDRAAWLLLACAGVAVGFALVSPFSLLDLKELQHSLYDEIEKTTPGADGLSPVGNFAFYLTNALPSDLTLPVAATAVMGIALALRRPRLEHLLLLGYVAIYLVGISASLMHWHRWMIQILPVLLLFSGYAIQSIGNYVGAPRSIAVLSLVFIAIQPAYQLTIYDLQQISKPPRIQAREWFFTNIPSATRLAVEGYGPPLGARFRDTTIFTLAGPGGAEDYALRGFQYLVVSSAVYERYFAEPQRYSEQVVFYSDLFANGNLVAEFDSPLPNPQLFKLIAGAECNCALHPTRGGPAIRVYATRIADVEYSIP